tara:strand:+ start:2462 stop:3001 length:540 start_codon:yes stop_codon:yes gene_type:complete
MIGGLHLVGVYELYTAQDFKPVNYPNIWSSIATGKDNQAGNWIDEVEYYQMWDDGWKFHNMMQDKYDKDYHFVFSIKNSPSSKSKYTHIYMSVGVIDEDVTIIEVKILGKSENKPSWDYYGWPENAIAHRITHHEFMYNSQFGDRYYLGVEDDLEAIKWNLLYVTIWECWESFENIVQI